MSKLRSFDVFDAKSCLYGALRCIGINLESLQLDRNTPNFFHPNKSALVRLGKFKVLGSFGELHPNTALRMGLGDSPIIFSIFPEQIPDIRQKFKKSSLEYSDYPSVVRDFAFVMRENVEVQKIMNAIKKLDKDLIKEVKLFDVFEGSEAYQQVGPGKKSLAFEVLIQPNNRTLEDKEIELVSHDKGKFGRILGEIFVGDSTYSINQLMIDNHHAVLYDGQSKEDIAANHLKNRATLTEQGKVV